MVIPARVELATYRLGGDRSILLSYGTMWYDKLLYTKKTVLATAAWVLLHYRRSANPGGMLHSTRTPVWPQRRVRQTLKFSKLARGSMVLVTKSRMVSP